MQAFFYLPDVVDTYCGKKSAVGVTVKHLRIYWAQFMASSCSLPNSERSHGPTVYFNDYFTASSLTTGGYGGTGVSRQSTVFETVGLS